MARLPTEQGLGHGTCGCAWCVEKIIDIRDRVGSVAVLVEERKDSIGRIGQRLGDVENKVATLEKQSAREEGRDEVRDKAARLGVKVACALAAGSGVPWLVKLVEYLQQGGN